MNYHFIGINGISMRALAMLCANLGNTVTGSDIKIDEQFKINNPNIKIYNQGKIEHVKRADVVVYTSAIKEDNIELRCAKELKKRTLERSEYLNEISKLVKEKIYVTGSHGKSSTTAIISQSFHNAGYGLIGHVGAEYLDFKDNLIFTGFDLLVSEGCEYNQNFLKLHPDILVILNIDFDHPDTYLNEEAVKSAYLKLAKKSKKIIVHKTLKEFFIKNNVNVITFSNEKSADYYYEIISEEKDGYKVNFLSKECILLTIKINTLEEYNILNFLAAYVAINQSKSQNILKKVQLVNKIRLKRRSELVGSIQDVPIILDYAHHPKEIISTYKELSKKYNNILTIFEPHTYSRTTALFSDFLSSLCVIENVILLPTFAAREQKTNDPVYELYDSLDKSRVKMCRCYEEAANLVNKHANKYGLILILGAGSLIEITKLLNMDKTVNSEPKILI